jgi:hypothetical protein
MAATSSDVDSGTLRDCLQPPLIPALGLRKHRRDLPSVGVNRDALRIILYPLALSFAVADLLLESDPR